MRAEKTLGELSDIAERARPTGDMAFRKVGGAWKGVPWTALRAFRREVAAALHAHGVRRGERVAILSHTCWEWGALDLAITTLGAISVGVYPTSTPEQIRRAVERNSIQRGVFIINQLQAQNFDNLIG